MSIYEWQNGKFGNKIQDIQIKDPRKCNTFTTRHHAFIACGRISDDSAVATTVLHWSGKQFVLFRDLATSSVYGPPNIFIAYGAVYFASTLNSGQSDGSAIFDFIGIKFIYHQSTQIQAKDLKFFTTAEREVFVTVANYQYYTLQSNPRQKVKSAVYKMADKKLFLYQQLPTTGAVYIHVFKHKGKIYVAVVNCFNGTGYNLNSQIYIWN